MANLKINKTVTTDVLVIGGGGAGAYAAVEVIRAGAKVLVVSKGKVGNSGNTIMVGGSYAMDGYSAKHDYGLDGDESVTKDVLLEQIIKQSFYLSEQDVAEQYVEDSPACVWELNQWVDRAGQNQMFMAPGGWFLSGHSLGVGLKQGLKENPGAELMEDVMIVDLLTKDGRCTGAVGVDVYSGEVILFNAKAVIVATGGYQPFTVKSTNSDMTGDGMAMAYRAGASLADMEFHLPCPTALEPRWVKGSLMPFIYECLSGISMPVSDKNGDLIVIPPEMKEVAAGSELEKLITTYYLSETIAAGRGLPEDGMYYDFTAMSDEKINKTFERFSEMMGGFYRKGYYHGDSIDKYRQSVLSCGKRIKVTSVFEYTMGGIIINKDMETTVSGLYAAGEAGSGVFGACRIADATTEMVVQGWKAGRSAAEFVKHVENTEPDRGQVERILAEISAPLGKKGGMTGIGLMREIEKAADTGFGICRTEENLRNSVKALEQLEGEAGNAGTLCTDMRYNLDLIRLMQAKNLLTCTLAGVKAAEMRKESRGFHMRHDYRMVNNDQWAVRIVETLKDGRMEFTTKTPKVTRYPIPAGVDTNIPEYIIRHDLNFKNADFRE